MRLRHRLVIFVYIIGAAIGFFAMDGAQGLKTFPASTTVPMLLLPATIAAVLIYLIAWLITGHAGFGPNPSRR
jgi:hypothetical protein